MLFFKPKHERALALLLLIASVFSLSAAYTAEYGFKLLPCTLCLYQRIPYVIVIVLAALALYFPPRLFLLGCGLTLIAGGLFAWYHTGVEYHFFKGPETCSSTSLAATLEDLKRELMGTPAVRCDTPAFVFLGVSMAGWNALWSSFLGIITLSFLHRSHRISS